MNYLLRPRVWPSFSPSCRLYEQEAWRPRVSGPATYRSGTPRNPHPAVARWHTHLRGLATAIHEISGLIVIAKGGQKFSFLIVVNYELEPGKLTYSTKNRIDVAIVNTKNHYPDRKSGAWGAHCVSL